MFGLHLDWTRQARAARRAALEEVSFLKTNFGPEAYARLRKRLAEPGLRSQYRRMLEDAGRSLRLRS